MLAEYSSFFNSGLQAPIHAEAPRTTRTRRLTVRSASLPAREPDTVTSPRPQARRRSSSRIVRDLLSEFPDVPDTPRRPPIRVDTSSACAPAPSPALKSSALLSAADDTHFAFPPAPCQVPRATAPSRRRCSQPAGGALKRPLSGYEPAGVKRSRRCSGVLLSDASYARRSPTPACPDDRITAHDVLSLPSFAATRSLPTLSLPTRSLRKSCTQLAPAESGWIV